MPGLLAFCENPQCGAVFQFKGLIGGPGKAHIEFTDTRVGPCPACGEYGKIPDGKYEYANEVISFLSGPRINAQTLHKIEQILRQARSQPPSNTEAVLDAVEQESSEVASALKSVPNQQNILQWLAILIALVSLAIQAHSTYFKESNDSTDKKINEHLLKDFGTGNTNPKSNEPYKRAQPKTGRNQPCPCGSGKKYKKCCYGEII